MGSSGYPSPKGRIRWNEVADLIASKQAYLCNGLKTVLMIIPVLCRIHFGFSVLLLVSQRTRDAEILAEALHALVEKEKRSAAWRG